LSSALLLINYPDMSKKPVNILYIIASLGSGGAERQVVELARALDKSRFHPYLVIYHNIIHFREVFDAPGVTLRVIEKKFKYDPTFPFKLALYAKKNKIDIIHAYSESAGFWGRLAGKIAGIKSITHIQNTNYSPSWFRIEKTMGWMDELIIANSYAGRDEYLQNIPGRKIEVIQNGLNFDLIPGEKEISQDTDYKKIISVGRISRQKNYICLLRALKIVKSKIKDIRVDIWGRIMNRDIFDEMMIYIKENNLEDTVEYRGNSPRVVNEIAGSDLLVLSSLWEGFPNVVMESLACGTPVIASDVADVKYLVKQGDNGFVFPSDDHKSLANRIIEYFSLDPQKQIEMGKAGRELVKNNYTIKKMAEKTGRVYEEIMEEID